MSIDGPARPVIRIEPRNARQGAPVAGQEDTEKLSPIRAVERVCDIFDLLQDAPEGLTLTTIADRTDLPKSTAHRYLIALESRGYAHRDEDTNTIRLGLAFRPKPSRQFERFVSLSKPILEVLRDRTDETTNLGCLDGGRYIHAVVFESSQMMRLAARVGERGMLHSTAIGKVIAANLPEDRVRAILRSEGMPRFTEHTITDPDMFLVELEAVRVDGYALDDCENQDGGRCVAVTCPAVSPPCGLSISAPLQRFPKSRVPEFVALLQDAAQNLTRTYRQLSD